MRTVENKHIVVVGAARSGVAVASLLSEKGADVYVTDNSPVAERFRKQLTRKEIPFEENGHSDRALEGAFAVLSPGVPTESPIVQRYLESGKKVFSEIEVASWFNRSPIIAVTGSNGKTTVTDWLSHTWQKAGRSHLLAGNIGYAFSNAVGESSKDTDAILEVSSFQLDHIDEFHPHISLLLNITPDHLNRYENSLQKYAESKFRITENQSPTDCFIYHYDDPIIQKHVEALNSQPGAPRMLAFSNRSEVPEGAYVRDQQVIIKMNQEEEILMPTSDIGLSGTHNLNNGLATALAARASEIKNEIIRESLQSFEGVEHRLELVRTVDGVKYYNDSKATNINAAWYALDSFDMPMVLILGGRDKGNDYTDLIEQIREKVHTLVAIGEAKTKIEAQLKRVVPRFETADTMHEAVRIGRKYAKRGEIVLLSPACASFDMFENFEHRGDEFKKAVDAL